MKMKNLRPWAFITLISFATISCKDDDPAASPEVKSYTLSEQSGVTWLEGTVDEHLTLSAANK